MAKATDKVKVTAKDGGETSPTRTKVGGEAMARKTKATQTNDKTEKSPKKRARTRGNNQSVNIARSRDTSAETVLKGWQMKTRQPPPQTRHSSLPSKMTSISSSKTRYTCALMTKSLMTKQWRKKWFTDLHTPCPKKPPTPTRSSLRKPLKTMTKTRRKSRLWETSQHLPLKGKTRPNTRLTCPPPLVTMIEKWVRKRAPHTAKSRHAPNQVNNLRLSRRPKVPKRATQKEQNKRETLEK